VVNLFTRLLIGCCVLKVGSPRGFRQWYYDDLEPWVHYVPVKADLSDLCDKIAWSAANGDECEKIAARGQAFALERDYDSEIATAVRRLCEADIAGRLRTNLDSERASADKRLHLFLDPAEDRLAIPLRHGAGTRGGAERPPTHRVAGQVEDRPNHRGGIARRDSDAAIRDCPIELGPGRGAGHHWPAARQHAGELRRHHQVGGVGALRQQMDVGQVEQLVEPLGRLHRQQMHARAAGERRLEPRARRAGAGQHQRDAGRGKRAANSISVSTPCFSPIAPA